MRGKVVWHTTMSLDGYIADQNDDLGWAFGHSGSLSPSLDETVGRTGAVLMGRRLVRPRGRQPAGGQTLRRCL